MFVARLRGFRTRRRVVVAASRSLKVMGRRARCVCGLHLESNLQRECEGRRVLIVAIYFAGTGEDRRVWTAAGNTELLQHIF